MAERLHPESLCDRFVAFRESLGMEVLPHSGGASRTRPQDPAGDSGAAASRAERRTVIRCGGRSSYASRPTASRGWMTRACTHTGPGWTHGGLPSG